MIDEWRPCLGFVLTLSIVLLFLKFKKLLSIMLQNTLHAPKKISWWNNKFAQANSIQADIYYMQK